MVDDDDDAVEFNFRAAFPKSTQCPAYYERGNVAEEAAIAIAMRSSLHILMRLATQKCCRATRVCEHQQRYCRTETGGPASKFENAIPNRRLPFRPGIKAIVPDLPALTFESVCVDIAGQCHRRRQ